MDVSLPNSTETAFRFHFAGAHGGYITADETLVATVTHDMEKLGLSLYLADGTQRSYFLGELEDLIGPEAIDALETNLAG